MIFLTRRRIFTIGVVFCTLWSVPSVAADKAPVTASEATPSLASTTEQTSTPGFFSSTRTKRLLIESAAGLAGGIVVGGGIFLAECLWESNTSSDPWCLLGAFGGMAGFFAGVPLGVWTAGKLMGADGYLVAAAMGTLAGTGALIALEYAAAFLVAPAFAAGPNSLTMKVTIGVLSIAGPILAAVLIGGGTALAYEYSDSISPRIRAWMLEARLAPTLLKEGGGLALVGTF